MRTTFALLVAFMPLCAMAAAEPRPPGGISEGPATTSAGASGSASLTTPTPAQKPVIPPTDHKYELGVRVRYLFVTQKMMSPFLYSSTDMNSVSTAIEFGYRKQNFDVVTSLDFSWLALNDGNYMSVNHPPDLDTHYLQFRSLSFLSLDVTFLWHHWFNRIVEMRIGAGFGVGVVLGNVLTTNNGRQCTLANANDPTQCYPTGVGPLKPGDPTNETRLKATEDPRGDDNADTPHRHVANKPPAMGVVNILIGLRFKLHRHAMLGVDFGFRDALFCGLSGHYLF